MLNYIIKNDNFTSKLLVWLLEQIPGIYGYFYKKNKFIHCNNIKDINIINPYIAEISNTKKLKAAYANGYGLAYAKEVDYKSLKELSNSNFKNILNLNEKTKEYDSLIDFFILDIKEYVNFLNFKDKTFLSGICDSLTLCKMAEQNGFVGVLVDGLHNLKECKKTYPNLLFICKNPSDNEEALQYANLIITNNIKNKI